MPRSVSPLILDDSDIIKLEDIISGRIPAGSDIQKRARAILLLSQGKQIKAVAVELQMRPNTICDMRKRFLATGMDSLEDKARSGRPLKGLTSQDVENIIDNYIESYKTDHGCAPTVSITAKELNCSQTHARDALKRRGLVKERKRTWSFFTNSFSDSQVIDIIGIYLSSENQILVLRVTEKGDLLPLNEKGKITTGNSVLASSLSTVKSNNQSLIQISDALKTYTVVNGRKDSNKKECIPFITSIIEENTELGIKGDIHLLSCGFSLTDEKRLLFPVKSIDRCETVNNWICKVEGLIKTLCVKDGYDIQIQLMSAIEEYIRHANMETEAFIWKKTAYNTEEQSMAEKNSIEKIKPGTIEFCARIMGDDGEWISYTSQGITNITQSSFDYSSPEGYLNSVGIIEQTIASMSHDAARGLNQAYLTDTAKKKR